MNEPATRELRWDGKTFDYEGPLGMYLEGSQTGRIHDDIIPKYCHINPEKLVKLSRGNMAVLRTLVSGQLRGIALKDAEEVRKEIRNTLDLTNRLLAE